MGRNRQSRVRGKKTNQNLCLEQGKKSAGRNTGAGGDVNTLFCLFPSSAVKSRGKEEWRSQRCAQSSCGLDADKSSCLGNTTADPTQALSPQHGGRPGPEPCHRSTTAEAGMNLRSLGKVNM